MTSKDDKRLRRLALQIAAQLPNDLGSAIKKFEFIVDLIEETYAARTPVK